MPSKKLPPLNSTRLHVPKNNNLFEEEPNIPDISEYSIKSKESKTPGNVKPVNLKKANPEMSGVSPSIGPDPNKTIMLTATIAEKMPKYYQVIYSNESELAKVIMTYYPQTKMGSVDVRINDNSTRFVYSKIEKLPTFESQLFNIISSTSKARRTIYIHKESLEVNYIPQIKKMTEDSHVSFTEQYGGSARESLKRDGCVYIHGKKYKIYVSVKHNGQKQFMTIKQAEKALSSAKSSKKRSAKKSNKRV